MNRIERWVYLVVGTLLALLCLVLVVRSNRALTEQAKTEVELRVQLSKAEANAMTLEQEVTERKDQLLAAERAIRSVKERPLIALTEADLAELKQMGLKEPAAELVQALQARPELIPVKAVLGGTMTFDPPETWVVSRPWIIAAFGDGHTGGRAVFRYQVENGKISFTLVEVLRW